MSSAPDGITIRAATIEDAAAVHALISELARSTQLEHKFRSSADDYRNYGFGPGALFEALVAEDDGGMVGVALYFYTFSSWRGEPGVYLQDLVVTGAARGRRIGERLLAELARVAGGQGATHLHLAVDRDNTAAMRFYERCGLRRDESDCIFQIDGGDFDRLGATS